MKIKVVRLYVNDQDKALKFYTQILDFVKKKDISASGYRWLTVVSPEDLDGVELHLELNTNPAAKEYQENIFKQNLSAISFFVDNIQEVCNKLKKLGVKFTVECTKVTGSTIAVFDDLCGNLIQIIQLG
jgi:predicted enzyme related to lactoylglutathione lyase